MYQIFETNLQTSVLSDEKKIIADSQFDVK